ncbi:MAG TPA: cupin domain-containing protein [Longimicrobiales bacterium]
MSSNAPRRFVTDREMEVETLPWGPHEWLCRPGLTAAEDLQLVRVRMPPGAGHAFHVHPTMEEIIYVISGVAEQWVGREMRRLGPGEIAHIPRGEVHGTYNVGEETLVFLAILSPAVSEGPAVVDVSGEEPWRSLRGAAAAAAETSARAG